MQSNHHLSFETDEGSSEPVQQPFLYTQSSELTHERVGACADSLDITIGAFATICTLGFVTTTSPPVSFFVSKDRRMTSKLSYEIQYLCHYVLGANIEFMGGPGQLFDGWALELEVDYYPNREVEIGKQQFGLHRDDYVRTGDSSEAGGVPFFALLYLDDFALFGPELMIDLGPEQQSTSLTVPQIVSLPPSFCRRIIEAKEHELLRRRNGELRIYCPIIQPRSLICVCEPLVIHQTPVDVASGPLLNLRYASDHASTREQHRSAEFAVNVDKATGKCDRIVRDLYDYKQDENFKILWDNTFNRKRSFLRFTFRVRKGKVGVLRQRGG